MADYQIGGNAFFGCLIPVVFDNRYFAIEQGKGKIIVSVIVVPEEGPPFFEVYKNAKAETPNPLTTVTKSNVNGYLTITDNKTDSFIYKIRPNLDKSLLFGTIAGEKQIVIKDWGIMVFPDKSRVKGNDISGSEVGIIISKRGFLEMGTRMPQEIKRYFAK